MLTNKELIILKRDLVYFDKFLNKLDHYDILYLTRSKVKNVFSSFDIYREWERIWEDIKKWITSNKLEMYIHIPFCEEFCDFCVYYKQLLIKNKEEILEKYINYLIKQMEFYAPAFNWSIFKCLSVWWWTPSILSAQQIEKLFWKLFSLFEFDDFSYKGIEFRPSSTNEDKLRAIKKVWFETIHFWVQSLDNEVLDNMNRALDTEDKLREAIQLVKKYDFDDLIIHLIRWLRWDTIEKFSYTLETLCSLWVSKINIYGLITNEYYLKKHYGINKNEFYNWWYTQFSGLLKKIIPPIAGRYNFTYLNKLDIYDHAWTLKNNIYVKSRQKYWYWDITEESINLFWFWPTARSYREGKIIYEWEKKIIYDFFPNDKIYLWSRLTKRDEMEKTILTSFRDCDKISRKYFYHLYWIDILNEFQKELDILLFLKKIIIEEDFIIFLETNKKMRMLYCMFIVWRNKIRSSIESNHWEKDIKW